jgi:mercuric ion transport protein
MRLKLNANGAMIGGFLAAIGASACCVGPLLLLGLGIGGAWVGNLTALEPYRPVFIVLVLVLLGLAFKSLYLGAPTCHSEAICAADRTRSLQKAAFWIVSPLLLALIAVPWLLPLFYH